MPRERVTATVKGNAGQGASTRRSELLGVAADLFATKGYAQTTVRDIAETAGILSGSLYHHFDSKEAMLDEILRVFLDGLHDRFVDIDRSNPEPGDALTELIAYSVRVIHDHPVEVALYQNEAGHLRGLPGFEYVAATGRRNEKVWLGVLRRGQKANIFREELDTAMTYRFIRDALWSSVRWYKPGGRHSAAAVASQLSSLVYGGILKA